ncbi:MAG: helix-turn-helix domain-containing protein [Defluviitaleaceae bacterium]|nr:helix-turn-helix domain-containing protein [Defluviitaleaceae bacterium]MCL2275241.1 helix-turn-helix domain-containing protein [Defluviitaleaceae bacterium]
MENTATKKPRLLTLKQAAKLIDGLTEYRVRLLCTGNKIKHHKFGNKYMIPERELLKHFDAYGENA